MKKDCPSYWRLHLTVAIILSLSLGLWSLIKMDNFPAPLVSGFFGLCWSLCGLSLSPDQGTLGAKFQRIGRVHLFLPESWWCVYCLISKISYYLYLVFGIVWLVVLDLSLCLPLLVQWQELSWNASTQQPSQQCLIFKLEYAFKLLGTPAKSIGWDLWRKWYCLPVRNTLKVQWKRKGKNWRQVGFKRWVMENSVLQTSCYRTWNLF